MSYCSFNLLSGSGNISGAVCDSNYKAGNCIGTPGRPRCTACQPNAIFDLNLFGILHNWHDIGLKIESAAHTEHDE